MTKEMRVGIFFVIGMLLLGGLSLMAGGFEFLQPTYTLMTYFQRVDGLTLKDPVTLAGVEVGEVKEMGIAPSGDKVEIILSMRKDTVVKEDSVASMRSISVMGGKYIGITLGSPETESLGDGDLIQSKEVAQIEDLFETVASAAEDIERLSSTFTESMNELGAMITENRENFRTTFETLGRIVSENEENINVAFDSLAKAGRKLEGSIDHIDAILAKVESGEGTLGKIVSDEELYTELKNLAANLSNAGRRVDAILAENEENISSTLAGLSKMGPQLAELSERFSRVAQKIDSGEGTLGKLVNEPELYEDARATVKELRKMVEDAREQAPITAFTSVLLGALQ